MTFCATAELHRQQPQATPQGKVASAANESFLACLTERAARPARPDPALIRRQMPVRPTDSTCQAGDTYCTLWSLSTRSLHTDGYVSRSMACTRQGANVRKSGKPRAISLAWPQRGTVCDGVPFAAQSEDESTGQQQIV